MNVYSQYQQQHQQQQQPQQQQYYAAPQNMNIINNNNGTNAAVVSIAPQQQGMIYNGNQWVPIQPQQPSKIEMYTTYYHQWTASHTKFQEQLIKQSNTLSIQERQDLENQIQWAKYYADLSSQAAHYFFNNPNAITAPFQLPPAPVIDDKVVTGTATITSTSNVNSNVLQQPQDLQQQYLQQQKQKVQQLQNQQQHQQQLSASTGEGALKRYVDRCLMQCITSLQKDEMIKLIEQVIQKHLQDDTYHTTIWDQKELLKLSSFPSVINNNINGNYGPPGTYTNPMIAPSSNSIYTPGGINNVPVSTSNPQKHFENKPHVDNGYYGPVSNGTKRPHSPTSSNVSSSIYGPGNTDNATHHKFANKRKKENNSHVSSNNNNNSKQNNKSTSSGKSNGNYYGPSTSETQSTNRIDPSSNHQNQKKNSRSNSSSSEEDFISFPDSGRKKEQKMTGVLPRKKTGFNNTDSALNDRARRFLGQSKSGTTKQGDGVEGAFDRFMGKSTIGGGGNNGLITLDEADYEKMIIKGTCQILEKDYLRLTAPPKPELVRPKPILEKHLINLKEERLRGKNSLGVSSTSSSRDYLWYCSQLKAIRQDCTVQHIQNAFTVDVYETHARIALEEDDLNEFNQCQTQLKELYKSMTMGGSNIENGDSSLDKVKELETINALGNRNEFIAYRIIYHVVLTGNKKYNGGSSDLFKIMLALSSEQRQDSVITHALRVREACCNQDMYDYHLFFKLLKSCPNMGALLMKHMIPEVRYQALLRICKGYRPGNVEVDFIAAELDFDSIQIAKDWLISCGCVLSDDGEQLVTKDCNDIHESVTEEKKTLI